MGVFIEVGYLKDTMASFDKNYVTSLHIPPQFWNFIALYHVENVPQYSLMKNSLNETTKKKMQRVSSNKASLEPLFVGRVYFLTIRVD